MYCALVSSSYNPRFKEEKLFRNKRLFAVEWKMLKEGKECGGSSTEERMGEFNNAGECAQKVKDAGGVFFIFSNDVQKHKVCYKENTLTATCEEGFVDNAYNFFEIKGKF